MNELSSASVISGCTQSRSPSGLDSSGNSGSGNGNSSGSSLNHQTIKTEPLALLGQSHNQQFAHKFFEGGRNVIACTASAYAPHNDPQSNANIDHYSEGAYQPLSMAQMGLSGGGDNRPRTRSFGRLKRPYYQANHVTDGGHLIHHDLIPVNVMSSSCIQHGSSFSSSSSGGNSSFSSSPDRMLSQGVASPSAVFCHKLSVTSEHPVISYAASGILATGQHILGDHGGNSLYNYPMDMSPHSANRQQQQSRWPYHHPKSRLVHYPFYAASVSDTSTSTGVSTGCIQHGQPSHLSNGQLMMNHDQNSNSRSGGGDGDGGGGGGGDGDHNNNTDEPLSYALPKQPKQAERIMISSTAVAACATLSAPEGAGTEEQMQSSLVMPTASNSGAPTIVPTLSFPSIDQTADDEDKRLVPTTRSTCVLEPLKTPPPRSLEVQTIMTTQNIAPAPPAPALPLPVVPVEPQEPRKPSPPLQPHHLSKFSKVMNQYKNTQQVEMIESRQDVTSNRPVLPLLKPLELQRSMSLPQESSNVVGGDNHPLSADIVSMPHQQPYNGVSSLPTPPVSYLSQSSSSLTPTSVRPLTPTGDSLGSSGMLQGLPRHPSAISNITDLHTHHHHSAKNIHNVPLTPPTPTLPLLSSSTAGPITTASSISHHQAATSSAGRAGPMASRNPAKPFMCDICGKHLASKNVYQLHLRSHSGEKPFSCQLCGNSFSQKTSLTRHMRSHTGERPYPCPICEKRFADKERIKIHLRTHTGEKPFNCSQCGKTFSQKSTVKRHMSVHTGERPYKCGHCGKGFANRGNLTAHTKTHAVGA